MNRATRTTVKNIAARAITASVARKLGVFLWDPHTHRVYTGRRVMLLITWSRDCDCCERDQLIAVPASLRTLRKVEDDMADSAEGPWSVHVATLAEALDFEPEFRDRILEAFEDGHPYSV